MEWTGLNELREKYLAFFESKGHKRLPSFPLVPQNDDTLLLINAGMAPLKHFFLGEETPPAKRVATCQKCIRTPDIERVGKTARHGTFFEMLGNFSFGDYFKSEACAWAWEFVTKTLAMPEDKLYVTIYQDDDEAFDIWTKEVGVDPSRISRFGREDNFWEHGSLPCGPCSEIYFDRGEQFGCGKPDCKVGCDCDRYVEFWNLVFQQFASDGKGHYTRLKKPNIDTGMGLERLACILQGVDNLFEVDTIRNIMNEISRVAGVTYGADPKTDVSLRVITDHIRSTVFMVADGVLPSNEGRGYVLRRLLRRAARHGRLLNIEGAFLSKLCDVVIHESRAAYPELEEKKDYIRRVLAMEEQRFDATIDQGLTLLGGLAGRLAQEGKTVLSGAEAFRLYDTFGFPLDLTTEILAERGMTVETGAFDRLMQEQREKARAARLSKSPGAADAPSEEGTEKTEFTGYDTLEGDAVVESLEVAGEPAGAAHAGDKVSVILDRTPFYAESGGQVGDAGVLTTDRCAVRVTDCRKTPTGRFFHLGEVLSGSVSAGDRVRAKVDPERRAAIMRNHSVAHLLQASLRLVLGTHVRQAGQLVDERRVRFDFTHFAAMTPEELSRVEEEVNRRILEGLPVETWEMPVEEAAKTGAMALFGEKYGSVVRVVGMGDFSKEFCGGTHVKNTAHIGLFKILSESSVAAGVRRIEGATGLNLLEYANETERELRTAAQVLRATPADLAKKAEQLTDELRAKGRENERLNGKLAAMQLEGILRGAKDVAGVKLVTALVPGTAADALRAMTDRVRETRPDTVAVLAAENDGKLVFAASCGADAVKKGAHAGKIVRAAAVIAGGGGGGRPESATAGGKDVTKADAALKAAEEALAGMIK